MILCNMCGNLGETDEMYFVSLLPHFTYLDSVLCEKCTHMLEDLIFAGKTIPFEWEDWVKEWETEHPGNDDPDYDPTVGTCGFYWSGYDEIIDNITHGDEVVCPECGGLAMWDCEDLGNNEYGEVIYRCLNCNWWRYAT